jgi:AmiR/NasT family two-component response regulator
VTSEEPSDGLRVLVADEDYEALDHLAKLLTELGHTVVARAIGVGELSLQINEDEPDIALVKLHDDDEHALDLIDEIVQDANCAVIALMEVPEPEFIARAAKSGIHAYVQPVTIETVQGAIEVASRRYADVEKLSEEVDQLEGALGRRAVIERAKGILMERHSADERAAFELLRAKARSTNRSVVGLAQAVLDGHALLPNTNGD